MTTKVKQYRITQTYFIELPEDKNIEEFWSELSSDEEGNYFEDEHIELIAEV